MKRKLRNIIFLLAGACLVLIIVTIKSGRGKYSYQQVNFTTDKETFELRKGDLLVRPNWSWLPGSYPVFGGRKFGHVGLVTQGASGNSVDEVLQNSKIIEALNYDQALGSFVFERSAQIREKQAYVSFGNKFKGMRYRLRTDLSEAKIDSLIMFLRNQLDGGYNLFSTKIMLTTISERKKKIAELKNENWHCASLIWQAVYLTSGIDLDANKGAFVFPSDIIGSPFFDAPNRRVKF